MLFESGQTILFVGDSITDAERTGTAPPYGTGYVALVRNLLLARYPELGLSIVNHGVGGDTTRDLAARWERDVVAVRPDWLVCMIGINDVWRAFGGIASQAVPLPEYTTRLRTLLDRARQATGARLILMTPYMIEPNLAQPMRRQMDVYGAAVREIAEQYDAVFVDTQAAFDAVLQTTLPSAWAEDQIHPNGPGHAVIALAFLRAVGFTL